MNNMLQGWSNVSHQDPSYILYSLSLYFGFSPPFDGSACPVSQSDTTYVYVMLPYMWPRSHEVSIRFMNIFWAHKNIGWDDKDFDSNQPSLRHLVVRWGGVDCYRLRHSVSEKKIWIKFQRWTKKYKRWECKRDEIHSCPTWINSD